MELNHEILADKTMENVEDIVLTSILIDSLTKQQKYVIAMKFIYGLSENEIAEILKISRQAVNRTKNRALQKLKTIWK